MNKHLTQLIEIASLDKEIDSFEPRIKEVKKELDAILDKEKALNSEIDELQSTSKELSLSITKNENHLADLSNKLEDIAKKSQVIKTEKESKALGLEEELAKEQISFANEEIERLNALIATKKDSIKELEAKLNELKLEENEISKGVEAEVQKVKEEQQVIFGQKNALVEQMDQKIISFYEKIRKWAKNTSVVPVTRQACGGCFMRLNDKVYSDIISSEEIINCPHCGRILFYQAENN